MPSSQSVPRNLEAELAVLDGPEWDSSSDEEEAGVVDKEAETTKNKGHSVEKKNTKKKKPTDNNDANTPSSVIYLGHLPVGFEERELRGFLSQFGSIQNLRLARSKKTSNPKGFAFCQFHDAEVAKIVADTMSGYLLLEKRLVCHVVPSSKVHAGMFVQNSKKLKTRREWRELHAKQVNQKRTTSQLSKITARLVRREKKKRDALRKLGIDDYFGEETPEQTTSTEKSTEETTASTKVRKVSIDKEETEKVKRSGQKKKKRKLSIDKKEKELETPQKEESATTAPQTDNVVAKKKKKKDKKRRKSAP